MSNSLSYITLQHTLPGHGLLQVVFHVQDHRLQEVSKLRIEPAGDIRGAEDMHALEDSLSQVLLGLLGDEPHE